MFTPEFYIDLVQSTKRQLTNQVYKDATLNQAANNFIDAQTAFAKMLAKNYIDLATYSVESISKVFYPQVEEKTVKAKTSKKTANTDINTQGE
jgi:hypothetical protein